MNRRKNEPSLVLVLDLPFRRSQLVAIERDLLLLEVPPVLLVHQHQVEVVLDAEPVAHVLVRGRQVVRRQEQPHRYALPPDGRAVHDLVLGDGLALVVRVRPRPGALSPANLNLHVLDLDPHEQEKYLTHDDIFKVVLGLGVLELDVQAVLDANLHLDPRTVELRRYPGVPDEETKLLRHRVAVRALHRDPHGVPQSYVDALVRLVRELDVLKLERHGHRRDELARRSHLSDQRHEIVRVSPVEVELDLAEHLDLHPEVVHALARGGRHVNGPGDGVPVGEQREGVERSLIGFHHRGSLRGPRGVGEVHGHGLAEAEERHGESRDRPPSSEPRDLPRRTARSSVGPPAPHPHPTAPLGCQHPEFARVYFRW
mmetsp:Transcript_13364/g.56509  ORF Transcript_13364/g.56509 Transcript_13364/m.56509 type:complete len:371 (+) Transcript_13364:1152-2264(+)